MLGHSVLIAGLLLAAAAHAQAYKSPRTPDGAPDLNGQWDNASMTSLQRPEAFKALVATPEEVAAYEKTRHDRYDKGVAPSDPNAPPPDAGKVEDESPQWQKRQVGLARVRGEPRSSLIVDPADGRLPYRPEAKAAAEQALKDEDVFNDPEGRPFDERCLLGGGGGSAAPILNGDLLKIIQTRDHVVLLGESNHEARIVRLGDRRHAPAAVTAWMGDPVGWWEGDTLVVETTNLSPSDRWRWNAGDWIAISPATRIVERFTRTGPNELLYGFEVTDAGLYTQPWRGEAPFHASQAGFFEYACHEGNYSLHHILAGGRAADRAAAGQKGAP